MNLKCRLFIALMLPVLLGARDPFQPPEDRCVIAKLPLWHYHGVIASQGRQIGLLRDAAGGWRRVRPETQLPGGWQVLQLNEQELLITTGSGCVPGRWRWPREGLKHETKDTFTGNSIDSVTLSGSQTTSGIADG